LIDLDRRGKKTIDQDREKASKKGKKASQNKEEGGRAKGE
jgi:hypothetical protein